MLLEGKSAVIYGAAGSAPASRRRSRGRGKRTLTPETRSSTAKQSSSSSTPCKSPGRPSGVKARRRSRRAARATARQSCSQAAQSSTTASMTLCRSPAAVGRRSRGDAEDHRNAPRELLSASGGPRTEKAPTASPLPRGFNGPRSSRCRCESETWTRSAREAPVCERGGPRRGDVRRCVCTRLRASTRFDRRTSCPFAQRHGTRAASAGLRHPSASRR